MRDTQKELLNWISLLKKNSDFTEGFVLGVLVSVERKRADNIIKTFKNFVQAHEEQENAESKLLLDKVLGTLSKTKEKKVPSK